MITHGAKRLNNGNEEIYHNDYGWMNSNHFFDIISTEDDFELNIETTERIKGESKEHFIKRANHFCEMGKYDYED